MNLVRLRTYVCCSGKRSYHTQPWNQGLWFYASVVSDRSLHIKYSYITRRVPTKSLSHGHLRLGRTSCLTHVHVCWSDMHWNLVFVNSVKAWSGGRVRPFSSGQFKDGKIQGSAKNGQFKDNWGEGYKISSFFLPTQCHLCKYLFKHLLRPLS